MTADNTAVCCCSVAATIDVMCLEGAVVDVRDQVFGQLMQDTAQLPLLCVSDDTLNECSCLWHG